MKSVLLAALTPTALGATIYLAGDSTMAKGGTGSGTAGIYSLLHKIINELGKY
jgi:rhamnogalacturonan acetylesterase